MFTGLLYSIRYYPIFMSLRQRNLWVRFFACIYILGNIGYIIIRRSSCMDFLPFSKGLSVFEQAQRRMVSFPIFVKKPSLL